MSDANGARDDSGEGVAAGAGEAVMGGQPANDAPAAEAQGVMGGTPAGGTGEDGLSHVEKDGDDVDEDEVKDNTTAEGHEVNHDAEVADTPAETVAAAAEAEEFRRDDLANGPLDDTADRDVETAKYRITGLVDHFDQQNNIQGQFAVGSIQTLPVSYGAVMVEKGQAEDYTDEEVSDEDDTTA